MNIQGIIGFEKFEELKNLSAEIRRLTELYQQQKEAVIIPAIKLAILNKMDWEESNVKLTVCWSDFEKAYMGEAIVNNDPKARYVFRCTLKVSGLITVHLDFREDTSYTY